MCICIGKWKVCLHTKQSNKKFKILKGNDEIKIPDRSGTGKIIRWSLFSRPINRACKKISISVHSGAHFISSEDGTFKNEIIIHDLIRRNKNSRFVQQNATLGVEFDLK